MKVSITRHFHYAECCILFTFMLNVIMLRVIILSVVMLNVIVLSVVAPSKHYSLLFPRMNYTQESYKIQNNEPWGLYHKTLHL